MSQAYRITALQVQRCPVKSGKAPLRRYDPAALVPVPRIQAGSRGVHGITAAGETVLDVHHQDHPQTRDAKGRAGILFMGTGDYVTLRARYGEHVTDGIAGETVLVDAPDGLAHRPMPSTAMIRTTTGDLPLEQVRVADPCVEFSRFCLQQPPSAVVDDAVRQALIDLDGGARGYRAAAAATASFRVGDLLVIG